jgi:hypothetical protein
MSSRPSAFNLSITREYARRLIAIIQTYRRFSWEHIAPSAERNAVIRSLQAVQGKLMENSNQQSDPIILPVTVDERIAIQTMALDLRRWYASQPATQEQKAIIADLSWLAAYIERVISSR